jgi:PKD repeat protein
MAVPSAYFITIKTGLQVEFIDYSDSVPTSWAWDFGDGSTDTVQNPTHIYATDGFYTVTFQATNGDGSHEIILTVSVGSGTITNPLDQRIWFLVDAYIPSSLQAELTANEKNSLISKWQRYLFPIILVETEIPEEQIHNELLYPPLVNQLVAELVAYDLIIQGANQFLSSMSNEGSSGSSSTTTSGQQKKKIETGPTVVEWYQDKTAEDIGEIGAAYASAVKTGGALDMIKNQICQLSKRLRVYLPMCGQLAHSPIPPSKVLPETPDGPSAGNPFGIPNQYL